MLQDKKVNSTAFFKKTYIKKNNILEEILKSEPKGIKHQQLADKLRIHRDILRKYMKDLLEFGEVTREGKKGKYHINRDHGYSEFTKGLILGLNFSNKILGEDDNILFNYSQIIFKQKKDAVKQNNEEKILGNVYEKKDYYLKYFEPKFDDSSYLEKNLFEFINQIGAYHIQVFLEHLYVSNIQVESIGNDSEDTQWLDGALNRIYFKIYRKFVAKFFEFKPDEKHMKEICQHIKENKLPKTDFVIKRTFLLISFFHMYPKICHKLHNMAEELGEDIKFHNKVRDKNLVNFIKKKQRKL